MVQPRVRALAIGVPAVAMSTGGLAAAQQSQPPPTVTASAAPMPALPIPENDQFYRQPGDLGDAKSGTVLRSREVPVTGLGILLPVDASGTS